MATSLEKTEFDFIIVGGGTAGCVLANRLTEDPNISVLLIEGGPDDRNLPEVLELRRWLELLGGPLDYGYTTTEQPRGNSHILHSRAKVLGGCSSHNTLICFRPFPKDLDEWVSLHGCVGWDNETLQPYGDRLLPHIAPVAQKDQNPIMRDWIASCATATGAPHIRDFDGWAKHRHEGGEMGRVWKEGVGWLSIAYTPEDGKRSSASVAYVHPIMDGRRKNLTILLETWVDKLLLSGKRAVGVEAVLKSGTRLTLKAKHEVLLCAGAVDSPRLLLLSGIGPRGQLEELGIEVKHDLPGIGENLLDHPESILMWETDELPKETVMESDAALFLKRDQDGDPRPDIMYHIYSIPFADNTERLGYPRPQHAICMTPNIPRPLSRGRLYLTSADPKVKPALDFRYFTDPEDYDARCIVEGIKIARKIAATAPFSSWLKKEIAPGPHVTSDEDLSEYGRKAAHTVYHPAGTCKMGGKDDKLAVVDPLLRVRGLQGVRVVDAAIFPQMVTANPMITVLMVAERAADLIKADYYRNTPVAAHI